MQTTKPSHGRKPGSMTRAMNALREDKRARVLRVGLVRSGRIVEERTLRANESLRVGASEKNELLIESASLGATFVLMQARDGGYTLRIPTGLRGRVSDGESVHELQGDEGELALNERSRGRLQMGDAVVLFQFVPEAAVSEGAQLPASVRGGIGRSIDWVFTCFVLASYMGFFSLVIYLENADWELEAPYLVPEIAARLVFNEPEPPMEQPLLDEALEATPDDVVAELVSEQVETTRRVDAVDAERSEGRAENPTPNQEAHNARIREMALANARSMVIQGLGGEGPSHFADLLRDGAPTQNADEVLSGVATVDFAHRRIDELRDRGTGGSGTGIGPIAIRDSEEVRTGPIEETRPRGLVNIHAPVDESGDGELDMNRVASTVRRRMSAIRRCYESELNAHPTLAGKVVVEFTVQESGSVTRSHAIENLTGSPRLASCLSTLMGNLRISPGPSGGSVTVQYPFVFALQQ